MNDIAIGSGDSMIHYLFDRCVELLQWLAELLGVGYQTINVWIFCILWPLLTVALVFIVLRQQRKIRRMKHKLENRK